MSKISKANLFNRSGLSILSPAQAQERIEKLERENARLKRMLRSAQLRAEFIGDVDADEEARTYH